MFIKTNYKMGEVRIYKAIYINPKGVKEIKTRKYIATGKPRGFTARGGESGKLKALELLSQGMMQKDVVKETGLSTYMVRKLKLSMSK
jgi:hypothetical protein